MIEMGDGPPESEFVVILADEGPNNAPCPDSEMGVFPVFLGALAHGCVSPARQTHPGSKGAKDGQSSSAPDAQLPLKREIGGLKEPHVRAAKL